MDCDKHKLLTFVVILLQLGSSTFAAVAAFSSHWGFIPSLSVNFGLGSLCNESGQCSFVTIVGADSVVTLLIVVFAIGFVFPLPYGILELVRTLGWFIFLGLVSSLQALLGFAAVIHAVVVLNAAAGAQYRFSYSFALAWISVLTAIGAGALSVYLYRTQPKTTESTLSDVTAIQTVTGELKDPPVNLSPNEWIVPPTS